MNTNQTIDGVPRELLEWVLRVTGVVTFSTDPHVKELRALLDAPACKACNDTKKMAEPGQEPGSCAACFEEPADQPQGVPVVQMELVENKIYGGMHIAKWDNPGGLKEGFHRLYAEQPAPVAVTLNQVLIAYDYADSHPHKYLRGTTNWCAAVAHKLNACLGEVTRLNAKE